MIRAPCARVKPRIVIAATVLPEPDSPTTPSVRPLPHLVGDPVDRFHHTVFGRKLDAQILDAQKWLTSGDHE